MSPNLAVSTLKLGPDDVIVVSAVGSPALSPTQVQAYLKQVKENMDLLFPDRKVVVMPDAVSLFVITP
jgi:hypothetical protein